MHTMGWERCFLAQAALAASAFITFTPSESRACGGCFNHGGGGASSSSSSSSGAPPAAPSMVTAHRMALAISPTQTVLWDSVSYDGDPEDFAWVLPVGPGARLEVANDAFLEALDVVTRPRVFAPSVTCSRTSSGDAPPAYWTEDDETTTSGGGGGGGGCGGGGGDSSTTTTTSRTRVSSSSSGGGTTTTTSTVSPVDSSVQVVRAEGVGPYEVTTVRSTEPGALVRWLSANRYAFDEQLVPVIDAFEAEGADFIALKLQPAAGVRSMRPVRIIYEGAVMSLPLRMVQAGTGARTGFTLYVIGEGRFAVDGVRNAVVNPADVTYYFDARRSDYVNRRGDLLAQDGGNTWLTSFARRGGLLSPLRNPVSGRNEVYVADSRTAGSDFTAAQLYVSQALANRETTDTSCRQALEAAASSTDIVVETCDGTGTCRKALPGELAAQSLRCGTADDVATALTGMHPAHVWVTRMEAELPRAALEQDLHFTAGVQVEVSRNVQAGGSVGTPCTARADVRRSSPRVPDWWPVALGAVVLHLARRRRAHA